MSVECDVDLLLEKINGALIDAKSKLSEAEKNNKSVVEAYNMGVIFGLDFVKEYLLKLKLKPYEKSNEELVSKIKKLKEMMKK